MNNTIFLEMHNMPPGMQLTDNVNSYRRFIMSIISANIEKIRNNTILDTTIKIIKSIVKFSIYITKKIKRIIFINQAPTTGPPGDK